MPSLPDATNCWCARPTACSNSPQLDLKDPTISRGSRPGSRSLGTKRFGSRPSTASYPADAFFPAVSCATPFSDAASASIPAPSWKAASSWTTATSAATSRCGAPSWIRTSVFPRRPDRLRSRCRPRARMVRHRFRHRRHRRRTQHGASGGAGRLMEHRVLAWIAQYVHLALRDLLLDVAAFRCPPRTASRPAPSESFAFRGCWRWLLLRATNLRSLPAPRGLTRLTN